MSIDQRAPPSKSGGRWCARFAAPIVSALVVGCVAIPIPTPRYGESMIDQETLATFEEGRTTRTDVLLTLGDPVERYAEDRFFVYAWNEKHGYLIVGTYGGGGGTPFEDTHRLILDFGATGVLTRMTAFDSKIWAKSSEADAWVQNWMDEAEAQGP